MTYAYGANIAYAMPLHEKVVSESSRVELMMRINSLRGCATELNELLKINDAQEFQNKLIKIGKKYKDKGISFNSDCNGIPITFADNDVPKIKFTI